MAFILERQASEPCKSVATIRQVNKNLVCGWENWGTVKPCGHFRKFLKSNNVTCPCGSVLGVQEWKVCPRRPGQKYS